MTNFYDALKALVSKEMIYKASTVVDEKEANISSAVSSIIPSFLGVFLKKGNTPQMRNILEEAGSLNVLADLDRLVDENPTQEQLKVGDAFLQELLGDKAADFTAPIAEKAGITKVATNRLVSMIAPVFTGYLGNKMVKEKWNMNQIMNEINDEKKYFESSIPHDLKKSFGLSSVLNSDSNVTADTKTKSNWWVWLLVLLGVLLLLFLAWRSCSDKDDEAYRGTTVTDTISTARTTIDTTRTYNNDRTSSEMTLPNGEKIQVYSDGVEDAMVKYLRSDDYKNAKDADLKEKWFEFDNIKFEYGSATELQDGSQAQINNIAAVLKNYPDARIKIAAFADKKGSDDANMKVSQDRAKTIENLLEKAGVGSQIVKVQGYGDEFAKHSANESDDQRAEDRDIALRFVKK